MADTLIRQYRLTELLGTGRHGETWMAIDEALQRPVVLKFLPAALVTDLEWRRRFVDERERLNAMPGGPVAVFFTLDTETDRAFLVREYAPGRSLAEDSSGAPLFYSDFLYIAAQLAAALNAAHSEEIVLANLTLENVIIDDVRKIRLVDCCLPWPSHGQRAGERPVDELHFRAPEQIADGETTQVSDVFSLGLIFYELLTGEYPIRAGSHEEYLDKLTHGPLDFSTAAAHRIPTDARLLLESMCAADPAERISSLSLLASIQEMHDRHEVEVEHVGEATGHEPRYNPRRVLILSLIAAILVVVWFVVTFVNR